MLSLPPSGATGVSTAIGTIELTGAKATDVLQLTSETDVLALGSPRFLSGDLWNVAVPTLSPGTTYTVRTLGAQPTPNPITGCSIPVNYVAGSFSTEARRAAP